jgi:hypothetical protein
MVDPARWRIRLVWSSIDVAGSGLLAPRYHACPVILPALVVVAWAVFGLQGYQNDPQSHVFRPGPLASPLTASPEVLSGYLSILPMGLHKVVAGGLSLPS